MSSDQRLLDYYERELDYLRNAGQAFAHKHPKVAQRLELSADKCPDPHVERLLEAFAFLTARIHEKLDDSLSDLACNMLEQLYPHVLRPIPSASVARFEADLKAPSPSAGHTLPAGTELLTDAESGASVRFKTAYPVTVLPIEVLGIELLESGFADICSLPAAESVLKVTLQFQDKFEPALAALAALRFYIKGSSDTSAQLADLLYGSVLEIKCSGGGKADPVRPMANVRPRFAGLEVDEALLPHKADTHEAYRLLLEYFSFPQKFQFFDLDCRALLSGGAAAQAGHAGGHVLYIALSRKPQRTLLLRPDALVLGCTPVINLFARTSEPLRVSGKRAQYKLVADVHRERSTEIYSVESVACPDLRGGAREVPGYFSRHAQDQQHFWHAQRAPSLRADLGGSEIALTYVDVRAQAVQTGDRTLTAKVLCTNRGMAAQIPAGQQVQVEEMVPLAAVRLLHKPSTQVQPPLDGATRWKLVSQLSLNHLSIAQGEGALKSLREVLWLNNLPRDPVGDSQIRALAGLHCTRVVRYVDGDPWHGYRNGYRLALEIDEAMARGSSMLLFGSVLHRFLGLFAGINTFVELVFLRQPGAGQARGGADAEDVFYCWPGRPTERLSL